MFSELVEAFAGAGVPDRVTVTAVPAFVPWFDCRTERDANCPLTEPLLNFLLLGLSPL